MLPTPGVGGVSRMTWNRRRTIPAAFILLAMVCLTWPALSNPPRGQADPPIGDWVPIGRPFGICLCCDFTVPVLVPSHDLAVGFAVGLDCGGMTATYIHLSSPFDRVPIRGTPPGVPVAGLYDPGRGRVVYLLTEWDGERETDLTAWALRLDDTLRWERLE